MKIYKTNLPQITLSLKKGEALKRQLKTSDDSASLFEA
jgi:hypothetical protein